MAGTRRAGFEVCRSCAGEWVRRGGGAEDNGIAGYAMSPIYSCEKLTKRQNATLFCGRMDSNDTGRKRDLINEKNY